MFYPSHANHKSLKRTVAPASEPITLTEAKTHLRLDETDDDTYVTTLIEVARQECENYLNKSLITQTWVLTLDDFPNADHIDLFYGPLQSVTSVKYYFDDDTNGTLDSSKYHVDTATDIPRIALTQGSVWLTSSSQYRTINAVEVTYVTGYGANGSDVPAVLKQGMLMFLGHLYENRTTSVPIPATIVAMWEQYRVETLA